MRMELEEAPNSEQAPPAAADDSITMPLMEDRFASLELTTLIESGHNPRTHFDPIKLADLAASIKQKGVVEPLVVRPLMFGADGGFVTTENFEIVAGARRFRAAKIAGLTHVPCVIRAYSDEDVLELTVIENIQRDDLDPLEEARGYRALLDANPARYSAAYIAERIGKSEKYVWDRMKLLDLIVEAQAHLEAGLIHAGHAILLARLKPEDQARAIDRKKGGLFKSEHLLWEPRSETLAESLGAGEVVDDDPVKAVTVRELEAWIAQHVRFDVVQAANAAPFDFGPVAEKVERAAGRPGRGKKVIAITHESHVDDDAKDPKDRTYTPLAWKRADGRDGTITCEAAVLGVVAVGPQYGSAFDVCIDKDCDVHWKKERLERERDAKKRTSSTSSREDAEEAHRKQEEKRVREQAAEAAWKQALPVVLDAVAAKLKTAKPATLAELVLRAVDHSWNATHLHQALDRLKKPKTAEEIVRVAAFTVLVERASQWNGHVAFPKEAKPFGIDIAAILKGAIEKKPLHTSAVKKAVTRKPAKKAKRR